MVRFYAPKKSCLLTLALLIPVAAWAVDPTSASSSIMGYAWRITNFICGISAIFIVGDIAWHARDMSEHGKRVKAGFMALVLLGCLYAVAAFILGSADSQGTSVSGLDSAMNMKP
ncbi:MAG: hypothetical protein ACREKE_04690 [bacterium]